MRGEVGVRGVILDYQDEYSMRKSPMEEREEGERKFDEGRGA